MSGTVEERLAEFGLKLPSAAAPAANYEPWSISRGLIFVAGQAPIVNGKYQCTGRVGAEVTLEAAQEAAKLSVHLHSRFLHHFRPLRVFALDQGAEFCRVRGNHVGAYALEALLHVRLL